MRVVVAGAGVIGCAIGAELARRGAAVTIVDPRPVGGGATQASAGMLVPYHEAEEAGPFLALAERSLALYDDFIDRLTREVPHVNVDYARTGTLEVAFDGSSAAALRARAAAHAASGVDARWVDAADAHTLEPRLAADVAGGLLVSTHGFVAQESMAEALARAASLYGASLITRTVRIVRPAGSAVKIETDAAPLEADAMVIAAGSWTGDLRVDDAPPLPIRPVRGQLLRLQWSEPPLARILWSQRCYLVPRRDGTLLVGATVEDVGFDERATVAGVRDLMDAACEVLPDVWRAGFKEARAGLRPAAPDGLPILGRSPHAERVVYATGHYRNGVLLAPVTAALIADLVLENRSDPALDAFSPRRFS